MPAESSPPRVERIDERRRLQGAHQLVVERDVVGEIAPGDEAVVGDHRHALGVRRCDDRHGRVRVDRIEDEHLGARGERRLGLLLLLRGILVGIGVEHLVGAELGDAFSNIGRSNVSYRAVFTSGSRRAIFVLVPLRPCPSETRRDR